MAIAKISLTVYAPLDRDCVDIRKLSELFENNYDGATVRHRCETEQSPEGEMVEIVVTRTGF